MTPTTCRDLGGPCDLPLTGDTADEVIKAQDRHLREAVRSGDATHQQARDDMRARWRHPIAALGWYRTAKQTFTDHQGG